MATDKRPPRQIEAGEQRALVEWADCHWWAPLLIMIANGAWLQGSETERRIRGRNLKREGLRPGAPDLLLAWPRQKAAGLFLEMKAPPGCRSKVSSAQEYYRTLLRSAGYETAICHGADQAIDRIRDYMGPEMVMTARYMA